MNNSWMNTTFVCVVMKGTILPERVIAWRCILEVSLYIVNVGSALNVETSTIRANSAIKRRNVTSKTSDARNKQPVYVNYKDAHKTLDKH